MRERAAASGRSARAARRGAQGGCVARADEKHTRGSGWWVRGDGVRVAVRVLGLCLLFCAALGWWAAGVSAGDGVALAGGSPSSSRVPEASLLRDGLVVPGLQVLDEEQQVSAAQEARWASPGAVLARELSQTAYRRLDPAQAAWVATDLFPALVERPDDTQPALGPGQRLVGYVADNAARVVLAGGRHGLVVSTTPIAAPSGGGLAPLNLALAEAGSGFTPRTPLVGLQIPRRLQAGVALSASGVSLTPVDSRGAPLGGSQGMLDGASVLYANTQTDSDTLAKATPEGFELDTLLRSPASPQALYFRVGLPSRAHLARVQSASGSVQIVALHRVLAEISAPSARDAEGRALPLSLTVSGNIIRLAVPHRGDAYGYPIVADPTVEENVRGQGEVLIGKTWGFSTSDPSSFEQMETGASDHIHEPSAGEYGLFYYPTQGESKIYSLSARTSYEQQIDNPNVNDARTMENTLGILNVHSGKPEGSQSWIGPYENTTTLCSEPGCAPGKVEANNDKSEAFYKQTARETPGSGYEGTSNLPEAKIGIVQEAGPSVSWNTSEQPGKINATESGSWEGYPRTAYVNAHDPGLGIARISWSSPQDSATDGEVDEKPSSGAAQMHECEEAACGGAPLEVPLHGTWPNGEDKVNATVEDAVGLRAEATGVVKVDNTHPYEIHLVGLQNNELGFGRDRLQVTAREGSGSTPSSGIKSIGLWIDGREVGEENGSCSPGPCTATGEWVLNGSGFAAGENSVIMQATSNAGLSEEARTTITFVSSVSQRVGPGSVNLASGAFTLSATDAAVASPGATLSVERDYNSRQVSAGAGPLGPQWQGLSFAGYQKLTRLSTGSVELVAASGLRTMFAREGASFQAPAGDANLSLKEVNQGEFVLSDENGDVTRFTQPQGGTGSEFTPASREEAGHEGATTYMFQTVGGVTEPTEEIAPLPAGVTGCTPLVRGCRALTFDYATKTLAKEAPSEWGEYTGRLTTVDFTAYKPGGGKETYAIARYAYDAQGRLRAEWDPQIEESKDCGTEAKAACKALKTIYGYDAEGHITALTPAGQQPWLFHYGSIAGNNYGEPDTTPGRLLSVSRPPASEPSGNDIAPASTEAPKLSTTTLEQGQQVSVSNGGWSNSPLTYSYQWLRCWHGGAECTPIPGAVNASYTVAYDDEEYSLAVSVTATNAGGSTTVLTTASSEVPWRRLPYTFIRVFGEDSLSKPTYGVASMAGGREGWVYERQALLVSDTGHNVVKEYSENGQLDEDYGERGEKLETIPGVEDPTGIAATDEGHVNAIMRRIEVVEAGKKQVRTLTEYYPTEGATQDSTEAIAGEGAIEGIGLLATPWSQVEELSDEYKIDEYARSYSGTPIDAFVTQTGAHSQIDCEAAWEHCEVTAFGATGTGKGQFENPADVAVSPLNHDIYVTDTGNDRVEYFSNVPHMGEYRGQFGEPGAGPGQFKEPKGIAFTPEGDVWVVDSGNDRAEEFTPEGKFITQVGSESAKQKREEIQEEEAKEPPKDRRRREKREARERKERERKEIAEGTKEGYEEKQKKEDMGLSHPIGIAVTTPLRHEKALMYIIDTGDNRVQEWEASPPPEWTTPLPPGVLPAPSRDATWTLEYDVPVDGAEAPHKLTGGELAALGTSDKAVGGTALFPPDEPMGWPAKDYTRASIYYLDTQDRIVNTVNPAGGISATQYNADNDIDQTLSGADLARAVKEKVSPSDYATSETYNSEGTELQSSSGPEHTVLANGEAVAARKLTKYSYGEGAPSEGGPYPLVTKQTMSAEKASGEEAGTRTTTTSYAGQGGVGWKLRKPTTVTADVGGLNLTHATLYDPETGSVIETRNPANPTEKSPHATEAIYYTAGENPLATEDPQAKACGEHAEWANLPCEIRPARQPETAGLPGLPVTTITYNIWDEPETTTETVETGHEMGTRTKTDAYDNAGRLTGATTATAGVSMPALSTSYGYNETTGALSEQSSEGKTITSEYNTLGQLVSYTDAAGNTATYSYDIDGRIRKSNDGKGTQAYTYNETTGYLEKLVDSAAGTFEAEYGVEGELLSETYPNGMTAYYSYNQVGEPVSLEYVKTSDCTSNCTWYSDSIVPTIEGKWARQTSTFGEERYSYDGVGRLSEVKDTPTGKGCTTRVYAYDADSDRTSVTTREPKASGKCATSGGGIETHTYDAADRLTDTGVYYNPFGDIKTLPAKDAGAELTSSYYSDNQLQSVTEHESAKYPEETIGYSLDPDQRTLQTTATGKLRNNATIMHYAGPGNTPAWTTNASGSEWSRNIPGINGQLAAIQYNGETPTLQLTNLHGDIIATARDSETATSLESTITEPNEYGIPATETPPKYTWLGAIELPTELPTGLTTMGVRTYIPQLGRFLQPDPDPNGSPNAYTYTFGDPLNETDSTGEYAEYTIGGPSAALIAYATQSSNEAAAQQAAENAAARAAAERARREWEAAFYGASGLGGEEEGGEEEWEWEEEGGYEYVSDHQGSGGAKEEAHIEPAVLYQPLGEGPLTGGDGGESSEAGSRSFVGFGSAPPVCKAGSEGPCTREVSGAGNCTGPHGHPTNCSEKHSKGSYHHYHYPSGGPSAHEFFCTFMVWVPGVGLACEAENIHEYFHHS